MPELVRSLTILNSPHPIASAEARQIPEQQQKAWYMLLFQFAGVAEEWLAKDDFANLRSFVFDTAAPGTFPPGDREVFCAALAREGRLTAALNYYRANIPPETWLKPPPDLPPVRVPTTILWGEQALVDAITRLMRAVGVAVVVLVGMALLMLVDPDSVGLGSDWVATTPCAWSSSGAHRRSRLPATTPSCRRRRSS